MPHCKEIFKSAKLQGKCHAQLLSMVFSKLSMPLPANLWTLRVVNWEDSVAQINLQSEQNLTEWFVEISFVVQFKGGSE